MDSGELREIKIATPEFEFLSKNEVRFELGLTGIRKIEVRIIRNQIVPVFGDILQSGQSLSVMNSVGKTIFPPPCQRGRGDGTSLGHFGH